MTTTPRRLVFGEVAESYEQHRPTYPDALVDDLAGMAAAGRRALEVGAGTGKATRLIAARGVSVLAIEPSREMAEIARRTCADQPAVEVVECDFERWEPGAEAFGLVYSAQAWHWVDRQRRYGLARRALAAGAALAVFWNRAAWAPSALRDALARVYREVAPGMSSSGPLHPDNPSPDREIDDDWEADIAAAGGLADARRREYRWRIDYDGAAFAGLVSTVSEVRLLDALTRERLLAAVRETIDAHGGVLGMPMVTRLYLARAV